MITITDIAIILKQLSHDRPIFHSEADFQHALAWLIHQNYPEMRVRLEVNPYKDGQRAYIDILLKDGATAIPIELKYKTRVFDAAHGDEDFHLLNQSARPLGRYDFIKDIARLERFIETHPGSSGFAIFLSNDAAYWESAKHTGTIDDQFRIHENTVLKGSRVWSDLTGGTKSKRIAELALRGEYPLLWQDYSQIEDTASGKFRYLLLAIRNNAA
jgi:hypothetical protein